MTVLLLDNHDSYTWNLAHLVARVTGTLPRVVRNDAIDLDGVRALDPSAVLLSPGPGRPGVDRDLGVCADVLRHLDRPLLGVCLGHQGLVWASGGRVTHAPEPVHGRVSAVRHDGRGVFAGLPQGLPVVRYHSLCTPEPLPAELEASAWSDEDGVVMALRHRHLPRVGLQFHPESIGTPHGEALIAAFLDAHRVPRRPVPAPRTPTSSGGRPAPRPPREGASRVLVRRLSLEVDAEAAFVHLIAGRFGASWLDSSGAQGRNRARFSLLGAADGPLGRILTWRHGEDPVEHRKGRVPRTLDLPLEDAIRAPLQDHAQPGDLDVPFSFLGGWVGWLGYGCKARWDHGRPTPDAAPDVGLAFLDRFLVLDHEQGATWLVALVRPGEATAARAWFNATTSALRRLPPAPAPRPPGTEPLRAGVARDAYLEAIDTAQRAILDGESYEVCLTQRLSTGPVASPLDLHRLLRRRNPAPYAAFLEHPGLCVSSSSPEQFLAVDRAGTVQARPIKGTTARHADPEADAAAADALSASVKDRAENLMIVDLLRHDLGRVCEPASVEVPSLMAVERFATVHHLVSTIQGRLSPERDALDAVIAAFPPGSMTGAPKERTVEILDALEPAPRGIYSGALGWLSVEGTADLSVVIRTVVCHPDRTEVGVGGAITALSDPAAEWDEAWLKAAALDQVLTSTEEPPAPIRPRSPGR